MAHATRVRPLRARTQSSNVVHLYEDIIIHGAKVELGQHKS